MAQDAMNLDAGRPNRWRTAIWGGAALMLLAPLIAMQFTREMNWDAADFAIFGIMLLTACAAYEAAVRLTAKRTTRTAAAIAIVAAFLIVWVELAVGIFD